LPAVRVNEQLLIVVVPAALFGYVVGHALQVVVTLVEPAVPVCVDAVQ
jgi:hypothetical protein